MVDACIQLSLDINSWNGFTDWCRLTRQSLLPQTCPSDAMELSGESKAILTTTHTERQGGIPRTTTNSTSRGSITYVVWVIVTSPARLFSGCAHHHTYTHTHAHMHAYTRTQFYSSRHMHMHIHVHVHTHMRTYIVLVHLVTHAHTYRHTHVTCTWTFLLIEFNKELHI